MVWDFLIKKVEKIIARFWKIKPLIICKDEYSPNSTRIVTGEYFTRAFTKERARQKLEEYLRENFYDHILRIDYVNTEQLSRGLDVKRDADPFPDLRRK